MQIGGFVVEELFSLDDLESALSELNSISSDSTNSFINSNMSEEMSASQKRYEDYIKKNDESAQQYKKEAEHQSQTGATASF